MNQLKEIRIDVHSSFKIIKKEKKQMKENEEKEKKVNYMNN